MNQPAAQHLKGLVDHELKRANSKRKRLARKVKRVQDIGEYLRSFKCAYDNCGNTCPMAFGPTEINGIIYSCMASMVKGGAQ